MKTQAIPPYVPTPIEIRKETAKIRSRWSRSELERRKVQRSPEVSIHREAGAPSRRPSFISKDR